MRRIDIVAHTHWDREWYLSFEEFRERLVETLDLVLDSMRSDRDWEHFHLDGQTAMIDDYLSVRPDREPEIRSLIAEGRLSCGPWTTLVDEFLVSGESLVRNLEDGLRRASELGGAAMVGYLPDQFGHIGQMPQILSACGIGTAVVWRGVPSAVSAAGFRWASPGGSSVRVAYLPFGYAQGAELPDDPEGFVGRLRAEERRMAPFLHEDESMLLTAGDDHEKPHRDLPALIDAARRDGVDVRLTSLAAHLRERREPEQAWSGELRSAYRSNLLPNTYSARAYQKLERAEAEHALERYAEPLAALVPGFAWPDDALAEAWGLLHLNAAHDSVCGCSTDDVAAAVDARTRRARAIAERISGDALTALASTVESGGLIAFNPSPFERDGVPPLGYGTLEKVAVGKQVRPRLDGRRLVYPTPHGDVRVAFEDQRDDGDLYTFCPGGDPAGPQRVGQVRDEAGSRGPYVQVVFDGCSLTAPATWESDGLLHLFPVVANRRADHRVRIVFDLPQPAHTTTAGAPFEIVERPRLSEGGPSEPPSPCWPARGFVVAGGLAVFCKGVFEYELTEDGRLAVTLLRATGTISRRVALATRAVPAGPAVVTPEAQMIGAYGFPLGVAPFDPGEDLVALWERYALPLRTVRGPGGGARPRRGRLLGVDVPALSALRRRGGRLEARVWNPWGRAVDATVGSVTTSLRPFGIETVAVDD